MYKFSYDPLSDRIKTVGLLRQSLFKIRTIFIILILLTVCVRHNFLFSLENHTEVQLKPPWELKKLSSALYEFLESPNTEEFARTHRIYYHEGKVRVYVTVDPVISQKEEERLISTYRMDVEKESENLLRVIVPVDELVSLAKETVVLSIRLPDMSAIQKDH